MAHLSRDRAEVGVTVGLVGHPGAGVVEGLRATRARFAPETRGPLRYGQLQTGRFVSFSHWPRIKSRRRRLRVDGVGGDVARPDEVALLMGNIDALVVFGHDEASLVRRNHDVSAALPGLDVPRVYGLSTSGDPDGAATPPRVVRGLARDPEVLHGDLAAALRAATAAALARITRPRALR
ncbi:MAG: hypothetical protein AAF715_29930 [Myxococcota bacterium]